jgi:hypothetical protein
MLRVQEVKMEKKHWKQINQIKEILYQFMEIKKKSVQIKKDVYPCIFVQGSLQTRLLYTMDYEKGNINIVVLYSKDHNKFVGVTSHTPRIYFS